MRRYAPVLLLALAACSNGAGNSSDAVAITATDTECRVAKTDLKAGDTTFKVKNDGKDVTEVYVYGDGDKVVTEKEDIGPGTSATFTADLTAGHYEIACKPGQKGNGIRTDIHVTGAGGTAAKPADREVEFEAKDFEFEGLTGFTAKSGETVKFEMENEGPSQHEFEVLKPGGDALGEIGPTEKGKDGEVTLTFAEPGTYTYVCGIADHESRGMKGTFTVS
ncbi:MAG TPA: cupredoxin domain-containing protein [Mycobacteriales bacterium]|nr:cupredoxin domain-containing protein [Mycobacteriales bacterium]